MPVTLRVDAAPSLSVSSLPSPTRPGPGGGASACPACGQLPVTRSQMRRRPTDRDPGPAGCGRGRAGRAWSESRVRGLPGALPVAACRDDILLLLANFRADPIRVGERLGSDLCTERMALRLARDSESDSEVLPRLGY